MPQRASSCPALDAGAEVAELGAVADRSAGVSPAFEAARLGTLLRDPTEPPLHYPVLLWVAPGDVLLLEVAH